jgi:hypothetical protein
MNKGEYAEYRAGEHWAQVVAETTRLADGKCVRCGANGDDCHHKHYLSIGREIPGVDVILVCRKCHQDLHGLSGDNEAAKAENKLCRECHEAEAQVCDHPSGHWLCHSCLKMRRFTG